MHKPVLLKEVLSVLKPQKGESYLDLTAGRGGHAKAVLASTQEAHKALLVDRDQEAIDYLLQDLAIKGAEVTQGDFLTKSRELVEAGRQFNIILADLGLSSPHLDNPSRGFSFNQSGPLDMRMDQTQELTADAVVNKWDQVRLEQILREYGEEPHAKRIAEKIVSSRPIKSTGELAVLVFKATGKKSKIHPATKTFQAIRIAVNSEISMLEQALPLWIKLLAPGGRIAVISFHSLEDRAVKKLFKELSSGKYTKVLQLINTKPITAGSNELVSNPRARSAKLRAAVKIKIKEP